MTDELINQQLGGYRLLSMIGEGGMASVYRAQRISDGEIVAIKVMARKLDISAQFAKRFEREARLMISFDHPHILPVYDFNQEHGHTYLVMKLLEGGSLRHLLQQRRLSVDETLDYIKQVGSALDYAHERGITHRDLKPANILLDARGNSYLCDFGIAKFKEESVALTAAGMVMGTPAYMAPEQWRTEPVDGRTDIYAFGVMIYEIFTGEPPFPAETPFSLMYRHLDEMPPALSASRPDLPAALDRVIRRAMAKVPEHRYPSGGAVSYAVSEAFSHTEQIYVQPPPRPKERPHPDPTAPTLDSPTVTDIPLGGTPVTWETQHTVIDYPLPDEHTLTPAEAMFITDDRTVPPVDASLEGHTLTPAEAETFEEEFRQYNAVDVGARSLLARAREAAQELRGDEAILAQAVVDYVQDLREQAKRKPAPEQGPYRALESYDIGDNKLFFGREIAIQAMMDRSPYARFTVLHAESGAGKTSLLRAGIMPRLLAGGYLPLYIAVRRRPPHEAIKHVLLPEEGQAPELAGASLRAYIRTLTKITGSNREIFIFIDQFETFFTDVFSETERADFISEIAECLDDELLPVRITLGMRTEYFGLLASFQPHVPQPFAHEFLLRSLTEEEARRALTMPALLQGYRYGTAVVDAILQDLSDAGGEIAPPQLQLVGGALIDILPPDRKTIEINDYIQAGRAEGVLRGYLERLLNRFSPENRRVARLVIEGLVRADQTRDVRTREGLVDDLKTHRIPADQVDEVIHALRENRVLRVVELEDEIAYELVHDYLALQVQLDPETIARKAAQELLDRRVGDYARYGSLLTQQELDVIAPQLEALTLTPAAHELIKQTRSRLRRQRRIAIALGTVAILGVIGILAVGLLAALRENQNRQERLELAQTSEARITEQRDIAVAGQVALQGLLELDEDHMDNALLLSVESLQIANTREAQSSLLTTLQAVPQLEIMLHEHTDWVRSVVWSPDGTSFASGSADGSIILWDAETHQPIRLTGHTGGVWSVVYSPDGKTLASAGDDGQIILWDVASQTALKTLGTFDTSVFALAFSPDGGRLASAHGDNQIRIWDLGTGEVSQTLLGHTDWVFTVAFSPDGKSLASGGRDAAIMLWDLSTNSEITPLQTITGHANWVLDVAYSPDGTVLASGGADNTLRLWDAQTGESLGQPITDHTDWVRSIAYSRDGSLMATGSRDDLIIIRDPATGQRLPDLPPLKGHSEEVYEVAFSPDGVHLVSGDEIGKVLVWDITQRQPLSHPLTGHQGWVYSLVYSPNGTRLFSASSDATALLWDVQSEQVIQEPLTADAEILSAAFDGIQYAYAAASGKMTLGRLGETPIVVNVHEGIPLRAVALNPAGNVLASAGDDGLIQVWNASDGTALREPLTAHTDWVMTLDFSPDGKLLASGGQDQQIILWDTATWQIVRTLPILHSDGITQLQFSHDGEKLVSASRDATLMIWDVASGEVIGSPLVGHQSWVLSAAFSPDDRIIASGGRDEMVILWDVASGQLIGQPLTGHSGWVWSVAFSPDGKTLASGSQDATIRLWDVDPLSWTARACRIANRSLSPDEWTRFLSGRAYEVTCVA
jgi:WD40 repeat protein/serine/threonine protein kinase